MKLAVCAGFGGILARGRLTGRRVNVNERVSKFLLIECIPYVVSMHSKMERGSGAFNVSVRLVMIP